MPETATVVKANTPAAGAASSGATASDVATAAVAANLTFSTEKIAEILTQLYGDAGLAGAGVAAAQIGSAGGDFAELVPGINWSTWVPGDKETAKLVAHGGLKRILANLDITIKGMTDAAVNRIGNVLAEGIAAGLSNQQIASNMKAIIADPLRTMVIARTEVARAMGASTLDSFKAEHINEWTWNTTEGACPVCLGYEAGSPYDVGEGPLFPGHPNCRCDPRAVLDVDTEKGELSKVGPKGYIHGWIKVDAAGNPLDAKELRRHLIDQHGMHSQTVHGHLPRLTVVHQSGHSAGSNSLRYNGHGPTDEHSHGNPTSQGFVTGPDASKVGGPEVIDTSIRGGNVTKVAPEHLASVLDHWAGADYPVDINKLQVEGAGNENLFGTTLGMSRSSMPVIPSSTGGVDRFGNYLDKQGVISHEAYADPRTLKATQGQLDGRKVGQMFRAKTPPGRLVVSRDGFVLDGHHRWAAHAARAVEDHGHLVPVLRADTTIQELIKHGHAFNAEEGITAREFGKSSEGIVSELYKGIADELRDFHGRWSRSSGGGKADRKARRLEHKMTNAHSTHISYASSTSKGRHGMGDIIPTEGNIKDLHNSTAGPHMDEYGHFTKERQALHDKIVREHLDGVMPVHNPVFTMTGGGAASGKSSMIKTGKISTHNKVHIDPDAIKSMLPEVQAMQKAGDDSWAGKSHEESSYLAARIQQAAFETKRNALLDSTGDSSAEKLGGKIDAAHAHGFKVEGHYTTINVDEAIKRANARAAKTGRVVPEAPLRSTYASLANVVPQVVDKFDKFKMYDNNGTGLKLIATSNGPGSFKVRDHQGYQGFLSNAIEKEHATVNDPVAQRKADFAHAFRSATAIPYPKATRAALMERLARSDKMKQDFANRHNGPAAATSAFAAHKATDDSAALAGFMDTDVVARLLAEVIAGTSAEQSNIPPSPEVNAMRDELVEEVAEIRARGLTPDLPFEWPTPEG